VWDADDGEYGPDLDHLALLVRLDGLRHLVDVGFGDNSLHPIRLEPGEAAGVPRRTRIEIDGDAFTLHELQPTGWQPSLAGTLTPRTLDDFTPRSEFLQHDPTSVFWQKPFATRALDATGSRVTLRAGVLRRREGVGAWHDVAVDDPAEWAELLSEHFGLVDTRP
jgi:N-hydroxyarylamine O-acetyltransferase